MESRSGAMGQNRDITFDIMKGIGILLVITCHFFGWNHLWLNRIISSFHMPMFFLVAGYFSKSFSNWDKTRHEVGRFFSRLVYPMVFTQLLIVVWDVLMALVGQNGWNPVFKETLSLLWADVNGPMTPWGQLRLGVIWFLLALFVAKSLLLMFVSRLKSWAIPVSVVMSAMAVLVHKFFPYSFWCISLGLVALPFVTIGWWFRNHRVPFWMKWVAIGCWVVAIVFSELDMYCFTWKCFPLDLVGACGGTICLYWIAKAIGKHLRLVGKVLAYLGMISLAIMCMHCFEMASHLGNHTKALVGFNLPVWGAFVWRYVLTIGLAIGLVKLPVVKKLFV